MTKILMFKSLESWKIRILNLFGIWDLEFRILIKLAFKYY